MSLEYTAESREHSAMLEFECSARQLIVQDIPLVNSSDKAMSVNSKFDGDNDFTVGPARYGGGGAPRHPTRFEPSF